MNYVVSDIHGYYSRFMDLLEQIQFNPIEDELYILGDCFDRGPENAEMLKWVDEHMEDPHIHFLFGNHDDLMVEAMRKAFYIIDNPDKTDLTEEAYKDFAFDTVCDSIWAWNGGTKTFFDMIDIWDADQMRKFIDKVDKWPLFYDININGRRFVLVHAGIARQGVRMSDDHFDRGKCVDVEIDGFIKQWSQSLLWIRENWFYDLEDLPCDVIFGHTPTFYIYGNIVWEEEDKKYVEGEPNRILHIHKKAHAIDTGRKCMGILRLEDMREWYSEV